MKHFLKAINDRGDLPPCNHIACKEMLTLWDRGACALRMRDFRLSNEAEK